MTLKSFTYSNKVLFLFTGPLFRLTAVNTARSENSQMQHCSLRLYKQHEKNNHITFLKITSSVEFLVAIFAYLPTRVACHI